MASKKGIIITIIILVTITAASFIIWQMPTNPQMSVVVSDFNSHIIGIDERYKMISNANDESFEQMIDGEISPDEYISIAEISSSQINSQIIELVESNATDEWIDSYLNNLESLSSQIEKKITKVLGRLDTLVERNKELEDRLNKALNRNLEHEEILESMKDKYKALKIANTITGSDNNSIKETKIEINSLIREVDYCISQLSD